MIRHFTHLHTNDAVDEEKNDNQEADVGQCFHRLNESPQEDAHCVALSKKLDQTRRSEES